MRIFDGGIRWRIGAALGALVISSGLPQEEGVGVAAVLQPTHSPPAHGRDLRLQARLRQAECRPQRERMTPLCHASKAATK